MHLADGVRTQDGTPFGEETVDLAAVLEVPIAVQPDALAFATSVFNGH